MDCQPVSVSGQILTLYDAGYDQNEIHLELKSRPGMGRISKERIRSVIRQAQSRSADSRRIFEIHEMLIECLSILRELKGRGARSPRTIETKDLPAKLGAALDRLTGSSPPGSAL